MLRGVGRWLRVAGYDTLIAESGSKDDDLLAYARAEGRLLVTCDRALAGSAENRVIVLGSEAPDDAARELRERLDVDWLHAPFTRCLLDNALLRAASPRELSRMPASAQSGTGPILACPQCGRVYWPGSHVRRMRVRRERWAQPA